MGQSRKQQLDKIFEKYPNKSNVQISKDHGIPYSTVYKYRKQWDTPVVVAPQEVMVTKEPVKQGFTEAQLVWAMIISFVIGALFVIIIGEI